MWGPYFEQTKSDKTKNKKPNKNPHSTQEESEIYKFIIQSCFGYSVSFPLFDPVTS